MSNSRLAVNNKPAKCSQLELSHERYGYFIGIKQMNNNEPDTLPDPAIGYIFQNDILALKQAFSLPDIDYADISQREQLAAALKRWPLLAEFAQQK